MLDPEVVAILDGEEMALPVGRSPRQVALLEIEQLDGVGRASPMNVRGRSVGDDLGGEIVLAGVEVVVEEVDPGGSGRVDRGEKRGTEPGGAADDQVDRPGPARLQDFPAAVRVAEASLERPRPGHGLLACRAADAENLQLEPVPNRGRPVRAHLGSMAIEPAAIAPPPHQPVGNGPEPAGKVGLNPEHMKRILGHGRRANRKERTA